MNIIFFGTPEAACLSLQAILQTEHNVVAVVSQPARPKGRGQKVDPCSTESLARQEGIGHFTPGNCNDPEFVDSIRSLKPDVGCVVAYGQFIGKTLRDCPTHGIYNLHFSLLPKFRGASPVAHALLRGEKQTGATMFKLVREMDAGPVALQTTYDIPDDLEIAAITQQLARKGSTLWAQLFRQIDQGTLTLTEQDHDQTTYAPVFSKLDGHIDWTAPPSFIINHIRALQGWPGTFTDHIGQDNKVQSTLKIAQVEQAPLPEGKTFPGTVLEVTPEGPVIACRGGALRLKRLQTPGHRMMEASDFLNGYSIQVGDRLT